MKRLLGPFFVLCLWAVTAESARPRGRCSALLGSDAGAPSTSEGLLLSRCREDAGQLDLAVDAAHQALALAAAASKPEYELSGLESVALRLDELKVDIEVPPPGTCGELPPAPGCAAGFFACTNELSGVQQQAEVAYERMVLTVARSPREARFVDDDGTSPTWGQPLRFVHPWQCHLHFCEVEFPWVLPSAHPTLVLQSRIEKTCAREHVGCRLEETDAGPGWLASVECRLVIADACRELVGAVCTAATARETAKQVTLRRVRGLR